MNDLASSASVKWDPQEKCGTVLTSSNASRARVRTAAQSPNSIETLPSRANAENDFQPAACRITYIYISISLSLSHSFSFSLFLSAKRNFQPSLAGQSQLRSPWCQRHGHRFLCDLRPSETNLCIAVVSFPTFCVYRKQMQRNGSVVM